MREKLNAGARALALLVLAVLVAGCATGVRATRISDREADRRLAANVLATGEPSSWSLQALHRSALLDLYSEDRVAALTQLHATLAEPGLEAVRLRERLFALSELSFDHARREDERGFGSRSSDATRAWYLASAVYAHGFMTLEAREARNDMAFDSRTRLAADLYGRALADGLQKSGHVQVADGVHRLPFGTLSLDLDEASLRWGSFLLKDFVPTAEFETRGIANRYRHPGVGAPLAAGVERAPDAVGVDAGRVGAETRVPSTLLMLMDFSVDALIAGEVEGRLVLRTADVGEEFEINGRAIPMEVDSTTALVMQVSSLQETRSDARAFLSGDLAALSSDEISDQLAMFSPYRPGRVPVVFVHGTYSDPTTWAEMLNELENDPLLSDRLQFWFFFYGSGNPIGYSGGLLAHALNKIVRDLDPEASDPALQNIVVVGHSQGGLLTKLTVVNSALEFWNGFFDKPSHALAVSEETREMLERSLIFEHVPSVSRVVFISTPHGGSFLTLNPLSNLVRGLISMPSAVGDRVTDVLTNDPDAIALNNLDELPTSIDNMRPGNRFLEALHSLPIVDAVDVHSIVAVQGEAPFEGLSDGVVKYVSAHIEQGTELVVNSGHSAQGTPEAIAEMRRILRKHIAALDQASDQPEQ